MACNWFHTGYGGSLAYWLWRKSCNSLKAFLYRKKPGLARARIFTVEEELTAAGHPLLGAAAVLHELDYPGAAQAKLRSFAFLSRSEVVLRSRTTLLRAFQVEMDLGKTQFSRVLSPTAGHSGRGVEFRVGRFA